MLQCLGEHAHSLPSDVRKAIRKSTGSDRALREVEKLVLSKSKGLSALVGTTQAIDLISGGVKSNALPERATALVNHRIAVTSLPASSSSLDLT